MRDAIKSHTRDFVAVIGMVVLAIGVAAYILAHERLRFPLIQDAPKQVWVEMENARGVTPGQGQTVRVAGMRVGDVGKVELEDGKARVRMDLDPEHRALVRRDATVLLRPRTGLKDMFLALDPGSGRSGRSRRARSSEPATPCPTRTRTRSSRCSTATRGRISSCC